jgi:hypothetical protein
LNYSFDQKWTNVASSRVLFILGNTAIQSFLTAANNQSKNFFLTKSSTMVIKIMVLALHSRICRLHFGMPIFQKLSYAKKQFLSL